MAHRDSDLVLAWRRGNDLPLLHRFIELIGRSDLGKVTGRSPSHAADGEPASGSEHH